MKLMLVCLLSLLLIACGPQKTSTDSPTGEVSISQGAPKFPPALLPEPLVEIKSDVKETPVVPTKTEESLESKTKPEETIEVVIIQETKPAVIPAKKKKPKRQCQRQVYYECQYYYGYSQCTPIYYYPCGGNWR